MTIRILNRLSTLLGLLLCMAAVLPAQTAQITGRVTDSSGAVVLGAMLQVTNTETGVRREVVSNEDGYFSAPLLVRGLYTVQAAQTGFKEAVRSGLTLDEGQTLRLDFALEVGSMTEKIEVSGAAPLLETERPTVSTVIPSQKILDMPTVGRNPLQFALLVPGVRAVGSYGDLPVSAYGGGRASIAGGSVSTNNYMVDGIAAETFTSGSMQNPLSVDATEEYGIRVNSLSPGAILTDMNRAILANEENRQRVLGLIPLRRVGDAEELLGAALLLVSSEGSYITGSTFYVDGGLLL